MRHRTPKRARQLTCGTLGGQTRGGRHKRAAAPGRLLATSWACWDCPRILSGRAEQPASTGQQRAPQASLTGPTGALQVCGASMICCWRAPPAHPRSRDGGRGEELGIVQSLPTSSEGCETTATARSHVPARKRAPLKPQHGGLPQLASCSQAPRSSSIGSAETR